MADEYLNHGIDCSTGDYLTKTSVKEICDLALNWKPSEEYITDCAYRVDQIQKKKLAVGAQFDPRELPEVGWGIIFPANSNPSDVQAIRNALGKLIEHRKGQVGERFKLYYDESPGSDGLGYIANESKDDFVTRHGASVGPVDPDLVPYYLLLVGSPEQIPFRFQYELDIDYAVGRIHFNTLQEYESYAQSVVSSEATQHEKHPKKAVFFDVVNDGDAATHLSNSLLVSSLLEKLPPAVAKKDQAWEFIHVNGQDASKNNLVNYLGGNQTPAFLFTTSHGAFFRSNGTDKMLTDNGAIICNDWPGRKNWKGALPPEFYFAAQDVSTQANLHGLIAFNFACFSGGTPAATEFPPMFEFPTDLSPKPFLAALPQKLAGHANGGALALIGHVERAWPQSFQWKNKGTAQVQAFQSVIYSLLKGDPVGMAMEYLNMRHASIATMYMTELTQIALETKNLDPGELFNIWLNTNDARNYVIFGDPAVRLQV